MNFREECEPYFVLRPLFSNKPGNLPDGNAILYCGVMQAISDLYETPNFEAWAWAQKVYQNCVIQPGLISRGSHKKNDVQAHDDYVGLAYLSQSTDKRIATDIVKYGRAHDWIYDSVGIANNLYQRLRFWHGRFPGQVQHYKICAGKDLTAFDIFWWSVGLLFISNSHSQLQLDWLRYRAYVRSYQKYWLCDLASKFWLKMMHKKFPHGMGSVFAVYYGPDHVFTRWTQGRI